MCPCRGQEIDGEYSIDAYKSLKTNVNRYLWYSERSISKLAEKRQNRGQNQQHQEQSRQPAENRLRII